MNVFRIFILSLALFSILPIGHAEAKVNKSLFGGVAIEGYDPVSYFTVGKPQKGQKQFELEHQGAKWYFSSIENRELFNKNPEKYAPQYGGFCAYAVGAKNKTASINPKNFTIHDGKLYLNYNDEVQKLWENEKSKFIESGDKNWAEINKK